MASRSGLDAFKRQVTLLTDSQVLDMEEELELRDVTPSTGGLSLSFIH